MDDFPAGPASPEPRRPRLSVVIPVHDGESVLPRCLRGLRDSVGVEPFEILVVDDGSTDASASIAESCGARVVRRERCGPAAARNAGAIAAEGEIIFFLDADVAVHPETLARALRRFDQDPILSALFGSYDDRPWAPGVVSQFRNLLHHFVHQRGDFADDIRPARTFWTGCGAIRKRTFPRSRRIRPRPLPAARDRGHRAGLPDQPLGRPDRARTRRPGHAPEAVDIPRHGPHRRVSARHTVDAADAPHSRRRDRPERRPLGPALGGRDRAGRSRDGRGDRVGTVGGARGGLRRVDRRAKSWVLCLPRAEEEPDLRRGLPFAPPGLFRVLRRFGDRGDGFVAWLAPRAEGRAVTSARGLRLDEPGATGGAVPPPTSARTRRAARWPR